jgi:hypothetical protein
MIHLNNTIVADQDRCGLETAMRGVLECPDIAGVGVASKAHTHYSSPPDTADRVDESLSLSSSHPMEAPDTAAALIDELGVDQTASTSPINIVQFSSVVVVNNGAIDRLGVSTCMMSATVDAALTTRHTIVQWLRSNPHLLPPNAVPTFSVIMDGANIPAELYTATAVTGDALDNDTSRSSTNSQSHALPTPAIPAFHRIVPVIKGDSKSYSVAAASILAKVSRDDTMGGRLSWSAPPKITTTTAADVVYEGSEIAEGGCCLDDDVSSEADAVSSNISGGDATTDNGERSGENPAYITPYNTLYPQYGLELNSGYGTALHTAAIREHGHSPVHRRSFVLRTTQGDHQT